jgi:hypothetical protein
MTENYIQNGEELLKKLHIIIKTATSSQEIINSRNFSAILNNKGENYV